MSTRSGLWHTAGCLRIDGHGLDQPGGAEPHWHPITAEMGCVNRGSARMTVMFPGGKLDTWYLRQGDVYFIPRAYPHHIEVVHAPEMHFCIFFDQPTPGDISYRTSVSAYSREVLAATFDTHLEALPDFPFTRADPLIVNRLNPLDAYALGER